MRPCNYSEVYKAAKYWISNQLSVFFPDIVSRAFWFIARQLKLNDLLEASFGNCESFNRLKEPLQRYMEENIFPPSNSEEENKAVVEQIISNFDDIMEPFVVSIRGLLLFFFLCILF